jgi:hypothetical protein
MSTITADPTTVLLTDANPQSGREVLGEHDLANG